MNKIDPDVTCSLLGRLGNNLFEVAATAAYAHRHGLTWAVPTDYDHSPRLYSFGFPVTDLWKHRVVWKQPTFGYTEIPLVVPGTRLCVEGYFQSYRYFDREEVYIRSSFKLAPKPPIEAVMLHVRRTDFFTFQTCMPFDIGYYARATSTFVNRGMRKFLVFSDDLAWCRANLPGCNRQAQFEFCEEADEYQAMSMMAQCHGHIICNSTFSWWGAFLSQRSQLVVCPAHEDWFYGDAKRNDMSELYPPNWIQIPAQPIKK